MKKCNKCKQNYYGSYCNKCNSSSNQSVDTTPIFIPDTSSGDFGQSILDNSSSSTPDLGGGDFGGGGAGGDY